MSPEGELDVQENEDDGDGNGEVGEDEEIDEIEDEAVGSDEGEEEVLAITFALLIDSSLGT